MGHNSRPVRPCLVPHGLMDIAACFGQSFVPQVKSPVFFLICRLNVTSSIVGHHCRSSTGVLSKVTGINSILTTILD